MDLGAFIARYRGSEHVQFSRRGLEAVHADYNGNSSVEFSPASCLCGSTLYAMAHPDSI
jgi:hypothetical protein